MHRGVTCVFRAFAVITQSNCFILESSRCTERPASDSHTSIAVVSGWTGEGSHDTNYFVPLLDRTAEYYSVEHILADKAYLSRVNAEFAEMVGAVPVIPTKINTVITDPENTAWGRLMERNKEQSAFNLYFKRNDAESVYSTIEMLFQKHIGRRIPWRR